jgi:hypothetical protein
VCVCVRACVCCVQTWSREVGVGLVLCFGGVDKRLVKPPGAGRGRGPHWRTTR